MRRLTASSSSSPAALPSKCVRVQPVHSLSILKWRCQNFKWNNLGTLSSYLHWCFFCQACSENVKFWYESTLRCFDPIVTCAYCVKIEVKLSKIEIRVPQDALILSLRVHILSNFMCLGIYWSYRHLFAAYKNNKFWRYLWACWRGIMQL